MRACKNTAFRNGFSALLLRTDESARVYAPAERCYYYYSDYYIIILLLLLKRWRVKESGLPGNVLLAQA